MYKNVSCRLTFQSRIKIPKMRAGIDYRKLLDEEIIEMGYVIAPEYQRQGYACIKMSPAA